MGGKIEIICKGIIFVASVSGVLYSVENAVMKKDDRKTSGTLWQLLLLFAVTALIMLWDMHCGGTSAKSGQELAMRAAAAAVMAVGCFIGMRSARSAENGITLQAYETGLCVGAAAAALWVFDIIRFF